MLIGITAIVLRSALIAMDCENAQRGRRCSAWPTRESAPFLIQS
jgi:hypothetical protein